MQPSESDALLLFAEQQMRNGNDGWLAKLPREAAGWWTEAYLEAY